MTLEEEFEQHWNWQSKLVQDGVISEKQNIIGKDLIEDIRRSLSYCSDTRYTITVSSADTGPDRQLFYFWDRDEHHVEFEIPL